MPQHFLLCALVLCYGISAVGAAQPRTSKKKNSSSPATQEEAPNDSAAVRPADTVQAPAAMDRVVVGGSGKYLIAFLPNLKKVVVLDVAAKQIAQSIPVDDEDVLIAAGETRLVVHERGKGVLSRYKLGSWRRELTVACEPYAALAMGSSSEGPLLAVGGTAILIDLTTLKATGATFNSPHLRSGGSHLHSSGYLFASADGETFGLTRDGVSPSGVMIMQCSDGQLTGTYEHQSAGMVVPGADGSVIYTNRGRSSVDYKPLDRRAPGSVTTTFVPAATGPFYLSLPNADRHAPKPAKTAPMPLVVHCQNDSAPLVTVTDVTLPGRANEGRPTRGNRLGLNRQVFFLPAVDGLVTVPSSVDQFVIQHFNVREELDKSGTDYFFVSSTLPSEFKPGAKLSYQIEVMAKHDGTKFALETGPPGMSVSPAGFAHVGRPCLPTSPTTRRSASSSRFRTRLGQELSHTIKLNDGKVPKNAVAAGRFTPNLPVPRATFPRPQPAESSCCAASIDVAANASWHDRRASRSDEMRCRGQASGKIPDRTVAFPQGGDGARRGGKEDRQDS